MFDKQNRSALFISSLHQSRAPEREKIFSLSPCESAQAKGEEEA